MSILLRTDVYKRRVVQLHKFANSSIGVQTESQYKVIPTYSLSPNVLSGYSRLYRDL
jgi:hypothetical protein